jgi:hypothetical protein
MVSTGVAVSVGVSLRGGVTVGVSVAGSGPSAGSVGSNVGDGGNSVGRGVAVDGGRGVRVGQGVGVGLAGWGRATMIRLITILPTMIRLNTHRIFWLVVRFWLVRLLKTVYLLQTCARIIPQPTVLGQHGLTLGVSMDIMAAALPGRCHTSLLEGV